jgi:hypothetical protein
MDFVTGMVSFFRNVATAMKEINLGFKGTIRGNRWARIQQVPASNPKEPKHKKLCNL